MANREPLLHEIVKQRKRDTAPVPAKPSMIRLSLRVHGDDRFP